LTVLLNTLIWDQHAKPEGIFCLFICIAGGMIYQQAPMRSEKSKSLAVDSGSDDKENDNAPLLSTSKGDE